MTKPASLSNQKTPTRPALGSGPERSAPGRPSERPALGRGLDALLAAPASTAQAPWPVDVLNLRLADIQPNPFQPRRNFDPDALAELANSIRSHGVLQPIIVRSLPGTKYQLIAGERRLRAARAAGLDTIPALVRHYGDQRAMEIAIIENLQRSDLNPIELAEGLAQLAEQFHLTQDAIAQQTGKERSTIANALRLLRLDSEVLELVRSGTLSAGQARPLVSLDAARQRALARRIRDEGWSARKIEAHLAHAAPPPDRPALPAPPRDANIRDAEEQLTRCLGTKVAVRANKRHRGTIAIAFSGLEEFQRLYDLMLHS
ncbi:MAG: ParB/RepB/Spo0J family partition protein [Terriglobales bacterium]